MSFTKSVVMQLEEGMAELGFAGEKGLLSKRVNSDAAVRVAYNTSSRSRGHIVMVSAYMQLQLDSVHQLGLRMGAHTEWSNTLSICLRYLAPEGVIEDYQFVAESDNSGVVAKATSDVSTYGLPVFLGMASISSALQAVEQERIPKLAGIHQFVPLAQYLLGRRGEALASAENYLRRMGDPSYGTAKEYAAFVAALRSECMA